MLLFLSLLAEEDEDVEDLYRRADGVEDEYILLEDVAPP